MAGGHQQTPAQKANSLRIVALNKLLSTHFALAVVGVVGVFALLHFARLYHNHHHQRSRGAVRTVLAAPFRLARTVLLRKIPKFSSGGHLIVVLGYAGVNTLFTFYDAEWVEPSRYSFFAKRCGWLCVCNAGLSLLLAMKNNPLGFLTGYSHERLNVLHRWAGRGTWFYACLHVVTYTITLAQQHNFEKLSELPQVYGYIAFAAFNLMFISALQFIRKRFYEAFWMLHVVLFVVAMVFMGLHKPLKYQWAAVGVAVIYALDRVIRTIRRVYYSWGNSATLIPLPGLATKIVFKRYIGCTPGSHAFVTIPAISAWQSHPFTISSVDGVEFVVKAQQNFTLDLHKMALKTPGIQVRAWIDGPYGAVPDFKNKDHVVLFAGGSGGAFLFPVALDIARNAGRCRARRVEAIWAVRDERHLVWYEKELEELQSSSIVNVTIHITSTTDIITTGQPIEAEIQKEEEVRESLEKAQLARIESNSDRSTPRIDKEIGGDSFADAVAKELGLKAGRVEVINETSKSGFKTRPGRPDITSIVREIVDDAAPTDLVVVGACGPTELMRVARNAVASNIKVQGPSVGLHCEQFGWG